VENGPGEWADVDFSNPARDEWPAALEDRAQWMTRAGETGKQPFAPWGDRDHPDADPDRDARWKWGIVENHAPKARADEWVHKDPRAEGWAFIQRDDDPLAFVDGDDVRDPETGAVHPAFVRILARLGFTYADVSTSGGGVHAYYRGELPDGVNQAVFPIDTDPWGANDDPPTVEIYDGKHVCVATGEHVPGTPDDADPWDPDALETVLDEYDELPDRPAVDHDTDRDRNDLEDYDPGATAPDETTDDVRDVLAAVDRLRPSDLPLRTSQVGTDSTEWEKWDPGTYRSSSGNDSLHRPPGEPVFHDHKHGESFGVLALFAAEEGILTHPWDPLRGAEWWDAVDAARDAGAPIPEYVGDRRAGLEDADPVAVLPNTPKARAIAGAGWDWTVDDHADDPTLSIDGARERTQDAIADAMAYADTVLVDALPSTGKSYGSIAGTADTETQVTILTGRGRKEQYEQYREWADEHGLTHYTLPAFTRDCPTAAGEHGDDLQDRVLDWYRRGATPKEIHKNAEYELGEPLPCQQNGTCPYAARWNFDPDDYDVILGHYSHAHKRKVTAGRTAVFDEFPGGAYETDLEDYLAPAVSHYLATTDALPFDSYTDLVENRTDDDRRETALEWFADRDLAPDELQVFDGDRTHAYAPLATYTILTAADLGNGWERADLGDGRIGLVDREDGTVRILNPPPLDVVRNTIALDGTPTRKMWEFALGIHLNHRQVLTDDERREYLRDVLGHRYVRTTEYVKPYNSEAHVSERDDAALLEGIVDEHDRRPTVVTSATAERLYQNAGIAPDVDDVDEINQLTAPDDGDLLVKATKHYGDVLGSNEFKTERLGAVIGSNHYGDGFIKKWGAYAGDAVERVGDGRGTDLEYTGVGDRILTHMREHDTLQAVLRFGRDGNGAVVYVHTNTLPDWIDPDDPDDPDDPGVLAGQGRVTHVRSDGERQVLEALRDLPGREWATAAIVDHPAVDVGERQVLNHLARFVDDGILEQRQDPDDRRRVVWRDDGIHRIGEHGEVELETVGVDDLEDGEVHELSRSSIYTWDFAISPSDDGRQGPDPPDGDPDPARTGSNRGDSPSIDPG